MYLCIYEWPHLLPDKNDVEMANYLSNEVLFFTAHSSEFSKRNYIFRLHSQKLVTYFGQIFPDFAFLFIREVRTGRTGLNS